MTIDPTGTEYLNSPSHSQLHRAGFRAVQFVVPFDAPGLSTDDVNGYPLITPSDSALIHVDDHILDVTIAVTTGFDGTTPKADIGQSPLNIAGTFGPFGYWGSGPSALDVSSVNVTPFNPYFTTIGVGDQKSLPSLAWTVFTANYNLRFVVADAPIVTWVTTDGFPPDGMSGNDPANSAGSMTVVFYVCSPQNG